VGLLGGWVGGTAWENDNLDKRSFLKRGGLNNSCFVLRVKVLTGHRVVLHGGNLGRGGGKMGSKSGSKCKKQDKKWGSLRQQNKVDKLIVGGNAQHGGFVHGFQHYPFVKKSGEKGGDRGVDLVDQRKH